MPTKKTLYQPMHPQKYTGEYPINLKSSWEEEFARRNCDLNPTCVRWAYEPHGIPYRDPLTGDQKTYEPDFLVTFITPNKSVKTCLVEIKPMKEKLANHARSRADVAVQARNIAKWKAAIGWCARRGWEFRIITEAEMFAGADKIAGRKKPLRAFGAPKKARK